MTTDNLANFICSDNLLGNITNVSNSGFWNWQVGDIKITSVDNKISQFDSSYDALMANPGNIIIGNGEWIISEEVSQERFASTVTDNVTRLVDSVITRLRARLPLNEGDSTSIDENPFTDGRNPFADDQMLSADVFPAFSNNSNLDYSSSTSDDTIDSSNTFQQPDLLNLFLGDSSLSFDNAGDDLIQGEKLSSEIFKKLRVQIENFTETINSTDSDELFKVNNTPIQSPDDLLTLFRNNILSVYTPINTVSELAGVNLFETLFTNSNGSNTQPPFDILSVALDGILPFSGSEDNIFNTPEGEIPIGYGNRDFGNDNAVIGNANWNYGNHNATIGNGNWHWDASSNNASIGNGNWHLGSNHENQTIGNGNWYWNFSSDNTTLGNGNWHFSDNNTTLGNGNWNFGSNNTIIGNGNWVFTDNSIVVGNGNWSVIVDKSTPEANNFLNELETLKLGAETKDTINHLVDSLTSKMGGIFLPLTYDLGTSEIAVYNQLFLS